MAVIYPATGLTDTFDVLTGWAENQYGDTNADHVFAVSTEQAHTSGKSLKAYIPASHTALQGSRGSITLSGVGEGAAHDVSFFLYIDPSSNPSADNDISICRIICTGAQPLDLFIRRNADKQWWFRYNLTGGDFEHAPYSHLTTGCWHQVRWRLSGFGAGTIVAEVWLDGIKLWWSNDTQVSIAEGSVGASAFPTQLWMGIVRYTPTAIGEKVLIYEDDVRVSNSGDMNDLVSLASHIPLITSETSVSITITSPMAMTQGNSFLYYGPTTDYGTRVSGYTVEGTEDRSLVFTLTGLTKGVTYHYKFELEHYLAEYVITLADFTFKIPDDDDETTVALLGDIQGLTNRASGCSTVLTHATPDLTLSNGDITDIQDYRAGGGYKTPDGVALPVWADLTFGQKLSVIDRNAGCLKGLAMHGLFSSTAGNHDYVGTGAGASVAYLNSFFKIPTTQNAQGVWYSFDHGMAHYLMLVDMGVWHTNSLSAAVLAEIEADLASTDKRWKIVVGHYPIYYVPADTWAPYSQAATLHALFVRQEVDLYCGAHRHRFNYVTKDGVAYHINGTGATTSSTTAYNNPRLEGQGPDSLAASSGLFGYSVLEVKAQKLVLRAYQKAGVPYPIFGREITKESREYSGYSALTVPRTLSPERTIATTRGVRL
jgi:hypothetical protein